MKEHKGSACHRNLPSSYDSGAQVRNRGCSLTDRLKVRATRPPAQGRGTKSVPRQGHNTPLPLKRSPPASFKRLLGGRLSMAAVQASTRRTCKQKDAPLPPRPTPEFPKLTRSPCRSRREK